MQQDHPCRAAVVFHEMYNGRGFSRLERSWGRYRASMDRLLDLGLILPGAIPTYENTANHQPGTLFSPPQTGPEAARQAPGCVAVYRSYVASEAELATVHSLEHIAHVRAMDAAGRGMFDRADTPVWPGVYKRAALAVGGTLLAAELVASGQADHVFHGAGGLHHAHYDRVSGFCIFNDIVAAVRHWQTRYGYRRIAVLDVDGHHGDGTQSLLFDEPVLTISLHQYDGRFFPRTGALTERGSGAGLGYCLNLPLPRFTTDAQYQPLLEIALAEIEDYRPEAIILQYGVDGHYSDRMVGLKLTSRLYEQVVERTHRLAHQVCQGRLVVVGGGGYEPPVVARCWSILLAQLTGQVRDLGHRYEGLHDPPGEAPLPVEEAVEQVNRLLQVVQQML